MYQGENAKNNAPIVALNANECRFDLSILNEMDDHEYTVEMISIFMKDTPRELKEIREASKAGVSDTVYKKAHKLKSSAGVLQANKLIHLLTIIETTAKSGKAGGELEGLLKNAEQEYGSLEQELKNYLKSKRA